MKNEISFFRSGLALNMHPLPREDLGRYCCCVSRTGPQNDSNCYERKEDLSLVPYKKFFSAGIGMENIRLLLLVHLS